MRRCCRLLAAKTPRLVRRLRAGFPLVGRIEESNRWPPFVKPQDPVSIQNALDRAWEFKRKIFKRCAAVPVNDNLRAIWKATIDDVDEGYSVGPRGPPPGRRGGLLLHRIRRLDPDSTKVRGCDSATSNLVNRTAVITEKLQLPSTDLNVATLREIVTRSGHWRLQGWVLDERKAYRRSP